MKPNITELSDFLCKYASELLTNGAYTSRVTRCTKRIANQFGYDIHITFFLKYISINLVDSSDYKNRFTQTISNIPKAVNFSLVTNLSALSWQIVDDKIDFNEAQKHFKAMLSIPRLAPLYASFFISLANAAFCKLFGGDFGALIAIFFGTYLGFWVRYLFHKIHLDFRAQYLFVSFVSSFGAYIIVLLGLTQTPEVAIGGSILYLIPGVLIINAFVDIIQENTLMGISRAVNMIVIMACLAAGVYITLSISHLNILV